ncbi:MAG: hypothetical protein IKP22_14405 [Clostridia bacterium]|nr:hypothetical protein [Clostridia bacterium]
MYTEEDFSRIAGLKKRRMLCLWIPFSVLSALVIVLAIIRVPEIYVTTLTILTGAGAIFVHGLFISPVIAYYRHLDNVMHGRTRTISGAFKEMGAESVDKDGVAFFPMMISVGNMADEEDDRLLYYDASLPRPDFEPGRMMTFTVHDKAVGKFELN